LKPPLRGALAVIGDGRVAPLTDLYSDRTPAPIAFHEPRRLEVIVHDPDGAPCAGRRVNATGAGNRLWWASTDAAGRVVFDGLPPGRYRVKCGGDGVPY
jgi:hypothetical protein